MSFREKTMKTLFKAIYKQKLKETQEILLNPRARSLIDFDCPNTNGDTILHMAAKGENAEIVKICLKVGVDPFMKNRRGKIAIELTKNPVIKELLKQGKYIKTYFQLVFMHVF
jgi:ankyrin repeat protein